VNREEGNRLGALGEQWVRQALERRGAEILATNWRCAYGELDIVAATDTRLLFVEVKTRRTSSFSAAREAVNSRKQKKLLLTAQAYLMEHPEEQRQPRFDVAEVYAPQGTATQHPQITYCKNALYGGGINESNSCF
jgi:putative endonuclease